MAIAALAATDIEVKELTPLKIKQSIVGTGRADKAQVAHMVCRLLSLPKAPSSDAADAAGMRPGLLACWLSMISRIAGQLLAKTPPSILVDVNGVGYDIEVPMSTFYGLARSRPTSCAADPTDCSRGCPPALRFCYSE